MSSKYPGSGNAAFPYVAPFVAFVAIMAAERVFGWSPGLWYPIRFFVVLAILVFVSRPVIPLRPSSPLASVAVGVAVFAIWIAPDALFGPGFRHHWLFDNAVTGQAVSSLTENLRSSVAFLAIRTVSCAVLVPALEELFWRGWMMRWLASHDFRKVPIGAYTPLAFWTVAVLFAAEHGPYWEVGLAAGIIYNWWIVRTKNLADAIVAHAVTNALLSGYILLTGQWQYWL
ncbi:MAG: CAAX prenyl protease-related protein [Bryobacteraceae bacterium]|jgi:CAAX prenyl protease-like protein